MSLITSKLSLYISDLNTLLLQLAPDDKRLSAFANKALAMARAAREAAQPIADIDRSSASEKLLLCTLPPVCAGTIFFYLIV